MNKPTEWMDLLNYSTHYGVSLSTLRRRIKAKTIQFKLENGKYLILAEDSKASEGPSVSNEAINRAIAPGTPSRAKATATSAATSPQQNTNRQPVSFHHELPTHTFVEASVLSSANRLVEEIKAAYAKILQEKEEQIGLLKEEAVDLRMLVRILEDSSKRNHDEALALRDKVMNLEAESQRSSGSHDDKYNANYDTHYENKTGAQNALPLEADANFGNFLFENFQSNDV